MHIQFCLIHLSADTHQTQDGMEVAVVRQCCVDFVLQAPAGQTSLLLKGEEDIRRLSATVLLVTDGHGVQFLIRNLAQMDRHSRKLLDRFL